jgi:hypothetical protein
MQLHPIYRSRNGRRAWPFNEVRRTDSDHHAMSSCVLPLIFEMRLFFEPVFSRAPPLSVIQTFSFSVAHG